MNILGANDLILSTPLLVCLLQTLIRKYFAARVKTRPSKSYKVFLKFVEARAELEEHLKGKLAWDPDMEFFEPYFEWTVPKVYKGMFQAVNGWDMCVAEQGGVMGHFQNRAVSKHT
jgi:hypothetical protein